MDTRENENVNEERFENAFHAEAHQSEDNKEQSQPQCKDGVCVLAWKPRRPNAA